MYTLPPSPHITKVHLKGYKSIIDTTCTFLPGLNVIIGDNGSGKSNFFDFLEGVIDEDTKKLSESEIYAEWDILGENRLKFSSTQQVSFDIEQQRLKKEERFYLDGNHVSQEDFFGLHFPNNYLPIKINYGVPHNLSQELSNSIHRKYKLYKVGDEEYSFFTLHQVSRDVIHEIIKIIVAIPKKHSNKEDIKNIFEYQYDKNLETINQNCYRYSNIQEVRISPNFILDFEITQLEVQVSYLYFEFRVNGQWLKWHDLSDGTKRLFYLISSVLVLERKIFLIEEPELGIHPNQLFKLMEFLKEQSQTKQIIISTHSPEILNHLEQDELDRIIICRHEGDAGTKMYHLEKEEKENLQSHMENEGFISDYWVHIGFDKEQMEE